jgi:hypothetical protein
VALFWLASMSWLVVAKVAPPLVGGQAPDYRAPLAEAPRNPPPVAWRLLWEERDIGHAVTRIRPADQGGTELRSLVQFKQLDVQKGLQQLLGPFSRLLPSLGNDFRLDLAIASRVQFDRQQAIRGLDSSIQVADMPHVLNLHGAVRQGRTLDVVVFPGKKLPAATEDDGGLVRHQIDLPRDALLGDALAPSSQLQNLEVGQTWTIPVFRPFPPGSSVQIVEAKAERLELLSWDREEVEVMVVAYRDEAGSGLGAAREPIGRVWVRPDGLVLKQEVLISNLHLEFIRLTEMEGEKFAAELDDDQFLPLLPSRETDNQSQPAHD